MDEQVRYRLANVKRDVDTVRRWLLDGLKASRPLPFQYIKSLCFDDRGLLEKALLSLKDDEIVSWFVFAFKKAPKYCVKDAWAQGQRTDENFAMMLKAIAKAMTSERRQTIGLLWRLEHRQLLELINECTVPWFCDFCPEFMTGGGQVDFAHEYSLPSYAEVIAKFLTEVAFHAPDALDELPTENIPAFVIPEVKRFVSKTCGWKQSAKVERKVMSVIDPGRRRWNRIRQNVHRANQRPHPWTEFCNDTFGSPEPMNRDVRRMASVDFGIRRQYEMNKAQLCRALDDLPRRFLQASASGCDLTDVDPYTQDEVNRIPPYRRHMVNGKCFDVFELEKAVNAGQSNPYTREPLPAKEIVDHANLARGIGGPEHSLFLSNVRDTPTMGERETQTRALTNLWGHMQEAHLYPVPVEAFLDATDDTISDIYNQLFVTKVFPRGVFEDPIEFHRARNKKDRLVGILNAIHLLPDDGNEETRLFAVGEALNSHVFAAERRRRPREDDDELPERPRRRRRIDVDSDDSDSGSESSDSDDEDEWEDELPERPSDDDDSSDEDDSSDGHAPPIDDDHHHPLARHQDDPVEPPNPEGFRWRALRRIL